MACDLRDDGCDVSMQLKISVSYEKSANPAKVDGSKEVREVEIQNVALAPVHVCVSEDGSSLLESVGNGVFDAQFLLNFFLTRLQQFGQLSLHKLQLRGRCVNRPLPTRALGDVEGAVLSCGRSSPCYVAQCLCLEIQQSR